MVCALAYGLTWAGHYTSGDGATKVAWAEAMVFRHSADIDPGPAVAYSQYGIGHSLLAMSGEESLAQVYREIEQEKERLLDSKGME